MLPAPPLLRGLLLLTALLLVACSEREAAEPPASVEAPAVSAVERPVISRKDDLPRHSYQIEIPAVALYEAANREVLMALAEQIRRDAEQDLASFEIEDSSTLQDFYADLGSVALMQGRWQDYLDYVEKRRALETKAANKLTMSLEGEAIARAQLAQAEDVPAYAAEYLAKRLAELPFDVVQDNLKRAKGRTEILSRALVLGSIESGVQPVLDNTGGEMSYDIASRLVGTSFALDYYIPAAASFNAVYSAVITANHVEKVDIWEARKVVIDASAEASPAVIAVWDSGVDVEHPLPYSVDSNS